MRAPETYEKKMTLNNVCLMFEMKRRPTLSSLWLLQKHVKRTWILYDLYVRELKLCTENS